MGVGYTLDLNEEIHNLCGRRPMATGKLKLMCVLMLPLSGCALLTEPPSESRAGELERGRAEIDRSQAVEARAAQHQRRGLSGKEARALAEAESNRVRSP